MAGYFGTAAQQALQARVIAATQWIRDTPGACFAGRFMAGDEVEVLGWENIERFVERDGAFGVRLFPAEKIAPLASRLAERGFRLDQWNVFVGDRDTVLAAAPQVLAGGLPTGMQVEAFPS